MHLSELEKDVRDLQRRVEALEGDEGTQTKGKGRTPLLNEDGADVSRSVIVPGAEETLHTDAPVDEPATDDESSEVEEGDDTSEGQHTHDSKNVKKTMHKKR